jgi:hypothetical protein
MLLLIAIAVPAIGGFYGVPWWGALVWSFVAGWLMRASALSAGLKEGRSISDDAMGTVIATPPHIVLAWGLVLSFAFWALGLGVASFLKR